MAFVALFCKSHHSPKGVASPADLVRRARALGYDTLGLCDEVSIGGFLEFEEACRAQGIRPVFGCRLFVKGLTETGLPYPIDFLIETEQGYRNLVRLLTRFHQAGEGGRQPLAAQDLQDRTEGLTAVIPPDGELANILQKKMRQRAEMFIQTAVGILHGSLAFGVSRDPLSCENTTEMILRLGRFLHIPVLAAPAVEYPEPGDAAASVYLHHPHQAPSRTFTPPADPKSLAALWPEGEILSRWGVPNEDIPHESGNVARRCTWRPGRIRRAFPSLEFERGFDPNSFLFDLVIEGATHLYGDISENLKQRINRELDDVRANHLAPYLLINYQICKATDEMGISRGVGRGRLVSSVLAYCLGISQVDPLQYNLVGKSLLREGETCPPIEVEIPTHGCEALLGWLREKFGQDQLCEMGRIQDLRRDQMINDLANWAGMTDEERKLTHREKVRLRSAGAAQRLGELTEGARQRRWRDPALLGDVAARLAPRPRHWVGMADRYVFSGEPLTNVVPRLRSHQGRSVSGLEEKAIDRLGLARLMFVPHHLLDILDQAMQDARTQNPSLQMRTIPLDDKATFELLGRGDTAGIPPLEGVTMRMMLRRHQPRNLLQLLRIKTEADAQDSDVPRDLSDELPDILLSYQCAYLKANYPLAFYGAAIGAVVDQHNNPALLIREACRWGYQVLPPDINNSDWGTTRHGNQIRLGLAAVRGFGRRAWEEVFKVRSSGTFGSLEQFIEQVDGRVVNLRLLKLLIAAGAMDDLTQTNRATMDKMAATLQRRYRQHDTSEEGGQVTLFELDEWEDVPANEGSEVTETEEWNPWEKMRRETEALGFSLTVDPISRFHIVLDHLRPVQVEKVGSMRLGKMIRLAGLVGRVEHSGPLCEQEGGMMVDVEGVPVWLPPAVIESAEPCLMPATEVMILGTLERVDRYIMMRAEGIWRLVDLEDQATQVASIRLNMASENRQTLKLLKALAAQYPGNTSILMENYPLTQGWTYRRLARRCVFFCSPLYQGLCKLLPPESIELINAAGQQLVVKSAPAPQTSAEENAPSTEPSEPAESAEPISSISPQPMELDLEAGLGAGSDDPAQS